jgi:biopolymer transport protein ExbB
VLFGAAAPSRSVLDYLGDGGPIGVLIVLLSIAGVALVAAQVFRLRLSRLSPPGVVSELEGVLRVKDADRAVALCAGPGGDCTLARIIGQSLSRCQRSPFGFLELRTAAEEAGRAEFARLARLTDGVGLVATVAPMLGLLGTVVGMVGAFDTLSASDGPAKPSALAGDISVALITTVLGLLVAIPASAAYAFLRARLDAAAEQVAMTVETLLAPLEAGASAPAGQGSVSAAGVGASMSQAEARA